MFVQAFLAATLLPLSSELVLAALLLTGASAPWGLWCAATAGNVLGALLNWWLGHWLAERHEAAWFPIPPQRLAWAQQQFQRHGAWLLLFAWVPVIGDPLTGAAGMLRYPLAPFLLLVSIGKGVRYALITGWT
jgi:membrane protein YqaA with SNARE-associated domain